MSIVDDARKLAQDIGTIPPGDCHHCTGGGHHREWCPLVSMPKIVAALEVHERLLNRIDNESRLTRQ